MRRTLRKAISLFSGKLHSGRAILAMVGVLLLPWSVHGSFPDIAALFSQTRYDEAANELLAGSQSDVRPGEDLLWQIRLSSDPDDVVEVCASALKYRGLPEAVRCQFSIQLASIEFSRNRHQSAPYPLRTIINVAKQIS